MRHKLGDYTVSYRSQQGFTLIEMLIAIAIGSVLIGAVANTFINQRKVYATQEQVALMVQNSSAGLDFMRREIMNAGYDPTETSGAGIVAASLTSLQFTMDLNGDDDIDDADEDVTYSLLDADGDSDLDLIRNPGGGNQLVAENFESLALNYILADETETTAPTAGERSQIRLIEVTLTARTAKPDSQYTANGGYRTHKLTMAIRTRNM